jgi:hypothetical protein
MKLRDAILALKKMRDVRVADDLLYMWINELEGRVQTEIMLADVLDVIRSTEEQYDANLLVLPPHDHLYVDWLLFKTAEYYGEYDRAQYHSAEFEKKYKRFAAWYMNEYRPAVRRRMEREQCRITTA